MVFAMGFLPFGGAQLFVAGALPGALPGGQLFVPEAALDGSFFGVFLGQAMMLFRLSD